MDENIALSVKDLKTYFYTNNRCNKAIDGVSFEINRGKTLCIVGESGCGKSVTASSIMQLLPTLSRIEDGSSIVYHAAGSDVHIENLERNGAKMREIRGRDIAMIFQDPMTALNPVYTVGFQIGEILKYHTDLSKAQIRARCIELLSDMGIPLPEKRVNEYPHNYSGGMRQRAMIAMAMACNPKILIADEPTTALDVTIQAQIFELMDKLKRDHGTAIMLITHDMGVVAELADDVAVMYMGKSWNPVALARFYAPPNTPTPARYWLRFPYWGAVNRKTSKPSGAQPPTRMTGPKVANLNRAVILPAKPVADTLMKIWQAKRIGFRAGITRRLVAMIDESDLIVRLENLQLHFPIRSGVFKRVTAHVKAVDGISLDVRRGEVLALVGESGCGKTTLGKSLLQLIRPTGGKATFFEKDGTAVQLRELSDAQMKPYRKKLQIVFQDPHSSLNPAFTIFGSLEDPLKIYGIKSRKERRKIIGDLLEAVNLRREYMDRYPNEFSGGQRQRIGIARALSINPELIVCDEAVSALDVSVQAQVLKLLMDLKEERNLTYIFITHDLSVTEYISDRIAVMYLGRVVELAKTEDLFANTLHPYTEALLSAIPVADLDKKTDRIILQGDVPSPVNPPSGCPFHPRCSYANQACKGALPILRDIPNQPAGHQVACHRIEEIRA